MKKFHLTNLPEQPSGFTYISTSADWEGWIKASLPDGLDQEVRRRLISNLKHVLVGLEMKAALIVPHATRGSGTELLFEPYFQTLNFEFCVGAFSICEGIGAALWLRENGHDGSKANRVGPPDWRPTLVKNFDATGGFSLDANVGHVKSVRDKLHQDQLGAREDIDWNAFSYEKAFIPALRAIQCLLRKSDQHVPQNTNLKSPD